ncbi:MAG TPA: hypothetical protein VGM63_00640 [Mucilaginibacter sp.]
MYKGLLKVILALFLFSVIYPGGYNTPDFRGDKQQSHHEQLTASAHLLSTVKILSHANPITLTVYGTLKPLWSGSADISGKYLTIICQTLFGQGSRSIIYSLEFFHRLLFPFHFFW